MENSYVSNVLHNHRSLNFSGGVEATFWVFYFFLVLIKCCDVGSLTGSDPETLRWNVQSELVHCRWAMLGAAGIFIPEFLTKIGILNTPSWYTAGELEYFTDTTTLFIIELILIGWAEGRRWADILKPGSVNTDPIFPNNKLTGTDVGYPGGLWFDPLGWGSGSPEKVKELRTKEIKNGRLAMLAVMGAWFQHIYTGTGPIDNLFAHLADPGHATVFAVSEALKSWSSTTCYNY